MDPDRLTLDNPAFTGRLEQESRGAAYIIREISRPAVRIHDVIAPTTQPAAVKPQEYLPVEQVTANNITIIGPIQLIAPHEPKRPRVLYAMASLLFVVGLGVSLQGFRTNHIAHARVENLITGQSASSNNAAEPPPATTKPTASAVASYQVAADLARYIDIPALKVHARVLGLDITKRGALAAPGNVYDAAWYTGSAKPGQPGAMLVDGHISSWTTQGVFYGLKQLVAGDTIVITRGDGKLFNYKVVKSQVYDADKVDMASLLVSADTGKPGLNLISCSGDVIPGTNDFSKRLAVFAIQN